jgi:predicted RNase H-like HicB family nuclease
MKAKALASAKRAENTPRYHINLFWSDEDKCWIADVPDLKPCSAHGETQAEAISEICVAMELWLEVAREHNMPIPEPRYRPAIYSSQY